MARKPEAPEVPATPRAGGSYAFDPATGVTTRLDPITGAPLPPDAEPEPAQPEEPQP